jgi:hypothetical protein
VFKDKNYEVSIADIQYGYNNGELIKLLKQRGSEM